MHVGKGSTKVPCVHIIHVVPEEEKDGGEDCSEEPVEVVVARRVRLSLRLRIYLNATHTSSKVEMKTASEEKGLTLVVEGRTGKYSGGREWLQAAQGL